MTGEPLGALGAGRYELQAVVGTGAFSTVYRAFDGRLDDVVALKVLAENHSFNPELRERFLTEGRALRRVHSENLLTVYDLGETDRSQPYLVLEYADRGTLAGRAELMRHSGWSPGQDDVRSVAHALASALAELHGAGIVHRDLNPRNVLLTSTAQGVSSWSSSLVGSDERLVVGDLGLCKDLARHSGYTVAAGTDGFRAPELKRGPTIVSPTADIWSLSAIVFWLLTGRSPDGADVAGEIAGLELAPYLGEVLHAGLADDPHHRYQDPGLWLQSVLASLGPGAPAVREEPAVGAHPAATPAAEDPPRPGWLRRNVWLWATLPLGITTWAAFGYIGLRARRRDWLVSAVLYAVGIVAAFVLSALAPTDADGRVDTGSWQSTTGAVLLLIVWLGGIVHGLIANPAWHRFRFGHDSSLRRSD